MFLTWFAGLLLLVPTVGLPEQLELELAGQPLKVIRTSDVLLPVSEGLPIVEPEKMDKLLNQLERSVYLEPKNATTDEQGRMVPEKNGRQLDRFVMEQAIYAGLYKETQGPIPIPYLQILPRVDQKLLKHLQQKRIGGYTTYFNTNNKNRVTNISLSSLAINNYVVFPGEVFSFNKVVGKRTREKGYLEAPVIVRGELSEGIGGGICQVSSTLFNAVDRAGLHIVQRYSHSRQVPYVPPGRDATVSWYGPDFRFQNRYPYPVLIRAQSQFGRVTIMVYSFHEMEHEPRIVPSP